MSEKVMNYGSRRIEIDIGQYCLFAWHLQPKHVGQLFAALMAEAAGEPVTPPSERRARYAWDNRERYRRIAGSFGRTALPLAVREAVFERDGAQCRYCATSLEWENYHCDHVVPVARGGRDDMDNLAASCVACNLSKAAKAPEDWRQ